MPTTESHSLVLVSRQNGYVIIPEMTPLTRLNYFDGKFLRASDLKAEQDYLRQLVAQSNQAGGAGVAHGFDLTLGRGDLLEIGQGLAIDPTGRVLLLPTGTSLSVQELIDKSRDLQQLFGSVNVLRAGDFAECELSPTPPAVDSALPSNLYLIVISAADALCGEEDVYGRLCEEACVTSTDRPFAVEGLIVRAVPLVLQTPLPSPKVVALTQKHLRSRVASAYFEDERRRVASLISKHGLEQETWCLGADAAGGSGVPIGVIARAGSTTVFLDSWIARRERIDAPAKRYWQWRMMMRPWDVFLAQILQFQCQLHDLFRNNPTPGGEDDPCGGARGTINEAADTLAEVTQFYKSTAQRFADLKLNLDEAMTFRGGLSRLTALNEKLVSVSQGLLSLPQDRFLISGGIVELPSAGYLPVVPGATATINQQVRRLMGEGVDLRFCVVRPDYVAHALEEAQHMERISLLQGLEDPANKPEVDILVPNGEVLEQKLLSPGNGFEASVDVSTGLLSPRDSVSQVESVNFRGAARAEKLSTGGGAFYLSCERQVTLSLNQLRRAEPTATDIRTPSGGDAQPLGTPVTNIGVTSSPFGVAATPAGAFDLTPYYLPRFGLWVSLRCDSNVFTMSRGDATNFNAAAIIASTNEANPLLNVELNGRLQIVPPSTRTGTTQILRGRIDRARLSYSGKPFGNPGPPLDVFVNLNVIVSLTANSAIEVRLLYGKREFVLSADWNKGPLQISADFAQGLGSAAEDRVPQAHADLIQNADVLSDKNARHIQALAALELIAKLLNDTDFADANARLLFPPPPKPTDELLVRGTMDWVLFHRRRTRRCSQEICVPPVAPARQYQVYHLSIGSLEELEAVRKKLIEGKIPESAFNSLPLVDFVGGLATLATDPQAWRADWSNIQPGNSIVYGGIANRDSAAADGDTLALTRLGRLVDAVAPVSTPNAQMQSELLGQVPSSVHASSVDGVIFLFTIKAADLRLTKAAVPGEVRADDNVTYTLTLTNVGPEAAQDVVLTDPVPANAVFVFAQTPEGWDSSLPAVNATGNVVFTIDSFAANATATFQIVVRARPATAGAAAPAAIVNTATVTSATRDPISGNNTAVTNTPILQPPSADLQITKSVAPVQYTAGSLLAGGSLLTYTLTLTNNGPTTAQNVHVDDPLPASTSFDSAQGPAGWIATTPARGAIGGSVSFRKDSFDAGQTATFQIVVRVNLNAAGGAPATIHNAVSVASSTPDPLPNNNSAAADATLSQPQPVRRKALVIFASFDSPTHFPSRNATRGAVEFVNNVPQGTALADVIHRLTPSEGIKGVMLATVSPVDSGAATRLAASVNIIAHEQGRAPSSYRSRTGLLTDGDKRELSGIGILPADLDEVIYLEPNPPT